MEYGGWAIHIKGQAVKMIYIYHYAQAHELLFWLDETAT